MHKKMFLKLALSLILTIFSLISFSQKPPKKFGKIGVEDFEMKYCPIDSNAHAYFIFDYGQSYFKYAETEVTLKEAVSSRKGFQLYFTRHFRIKIVDNQGFSWANIEIPLYHDKDEEKTDRIKAYTYNLENDKIVKTKLKKGDILIEETSKYWNTEKFAMPGVREGSIIEIEYTVVSDFYFNLRQWYFQKTIPVLQSEYHTRIPEYFSFNQTQRGYLPIQTENSRRAKELKIAYHQKAEGQSVKEENYTNTYNYIEYFSDYYVNEIPAFPIEEYLRTEDNYLSKVEFELQYTKFPKSTQHNYTTSWEEINKNLLDSYGLGKQLNKTGGDWINLMDYRSYSSVDFCKITIDKNLVLNGIKNMRLKDYAAYQYKKKIKRFNNIKEYEKSIGEQEDNLTVSDMKISGIDTLKKRVDILYQFKQNNYVDKTDDLAFFSPAFQPFVTEDPFKLDKREFPVEFNYPYSVRQVFSFTIPENYEVSEMPKPAIVKLPNNGARFVYNVTQMNNSINLTLMFSINKTLFLPEEYQAIKGFYQMIIDKQKELVVLKAVE